jgi:hypothetical protein
MSFENEVEQRCSRPGLDVSLQGRDGSLVALDQIGDDGGIGLDRAGRLAAGGAHTVPSSGTTG